MGLSRIRRAFIAASPRDGGEVEQKVIALIELVGSAEREQVESRRGVVDGEEEGEGESLSIHISDPNLSGLV